MKRTTALVLALLVCSCVWNLASTAPAMSEKKDNPCHIGRNPVATDRHYNTNTEFLVTVKDPTWIQMLNRDNHKSECQLMPGTEVVASRGTGQWLRVLECGNPLVGPRHTSPVPRQESFAPPVQKFLPSPEPKKHEPAPYLQTRSYNFLGIGAGVYNGLLTGVDGGHIFPNGLMLQGNLLHGHENRGSMTSQVRICDDRFDDQHILSLECFDNPECRDFTARGSYGGNHRNGWLAGIGYAWNMPRKVIMPKGLHGGFSFVGINAGRYRGSLTALNAGHVFANGVKVTGWLMHGTPNTEVMTTTVRVSEDDFSSGTSLQYPGSKDFHGETVYDGGNHLAGMVGLGYVW